ncbi:AraC family transcriptional regulator [Rhodanobacter thiooxydans]|uniref:AraC family transcriptional regulator n=1 Tax=Rhodanobacter thiooxydans TaxID=416169 RepID=A0A154QG69_9GAMM|nr:AraC family transcriptional regulator [Rhodanobacter thiooxydans]KZC23273.1 AraC family transcriptional regulator [Rhodanobacter thiooxydans]
MQHLARTNFGRPERLHTSGGLRVSVTNYAGDSALPWHEHDDPYLCLVAAGGYTQRAAGGDTECSSGLLLVHPQGHRHANRFASLGARCLSMFLSAELAADTGVRRLLGDHRLLQLPDAVHLRQRIERELAAGDDAAALALHAAVLELVAHACRQGHAPNRPGWLPRVLERLHDDPLASPSLQELATLAGVHPAHLARRFQQTQGVSVGEYQRGLRIAIARKALAEGSRPIAAVAAEAGFADQSHFARVFKRMTGQTPRDFRRGVQKAS